MAASVLSNSWVLFKKTGLMNTMLLKNIYTCRKFLLSAIYCLIFLQSKDSLERKHEIICFMFRNTFFHKNTVGEGSAQNLQCTKKKCGSAKSDVSKVLFPDIGKITKHWLVIYPMPGNNATLRINFTDLRKWNFVRSLFETVLRKWYTCLWIKLGWKQLNWFPYQITNK